MDTQDIVQENWRTELQKEVLKAISGKDEEKVSASLNFYRMYCDAAPAFIYKYYSDDSKYLNSIRNNKLWYSAPCKFNDVFDSDITIDEKAIFQEMLRLASPNKPIREGSLIWRRISDGLKSGLKTLREKIDEVRTSTGVACLTEKDDSLLMWAHYANNHRGMCVEYDLLKIVKELKFALIPVVYSNKRVTLNKLNPLTVNQDAQALVIESLTSKSIEWSYENEWRIIRDSRACGESWEEDKNGALLGMIKPTSITLGCEAKSEFEMKVKEFCKENSINLYKMKKDLKKYKLNKTLVI